MIPCGPRLMQHCIKYSGSISNSVCYHGLHTELLLDNFVDISLRYVYLLCLLCNFVCLIREDAAPGAHVKIRVQKLDPYLN